MAQANLNNDPQTVDTGNDSIVIMSCLEDVPGGRTLDTTGFTPTVIKGGHVVIQDADGEYKPMPVSGSNYAVLPADHTYLGVVKASVLTTKPMVSIVVRGAINQVASPYPVTAAIKTALPLIRFTQD